VPSAGSTQASAELLGGACAATGSVAVTGSAADGGDGLSTRGLGGYGAGWDSQLNPVSERCDSNHFHTA
jgi:hypothetical protein